jgi:hypothetical protein
MAEDLVEHLAVLETHGVDRSTPPLPPPLMAPDLARALLRIAERTHNADLYRTAGPGPGSVRIVLGSAYVRTGSADTLASRVQLWLESDLSTKLRKSLANEPSGTDRHAVLVFDRATEPEYRSADEQGLSYLPTVPLALPDVIDTIWLVLDPVALRYSPATGWTSSNVPPATSSA